MANTGFRRAKRLKRRFDGVVDVFARYAGWLGLGLLAGCAALWLVPSEQWQGRLGLDAARLPVYTLISLVGASLLGWRYVNLGQGRISRGLGRGLSFVVFLALPVGCLVAEIARQPLSEAIGTHGTGHPFWRFVHWYPPGVIILCAAVFLLWKSKPRKRVYFERGLGYALLLAPYAMLFTFIHLGVHLEWLDHSMRETFASLGQWSLVLQLVMAYFVGAD